MIRVLAVAAAVGVISFGLAPTALAAPQMSGFGEAGPSYGFSPDLPASPLSEQNAVRAAENYLEMTAFSRRGLIQQLVIGDGYSEADATLAVDSLNADWNAQAVKAAQNYLEMTAFSRQGLIQQLTIGDGFTPGQAAYGVAATGL